MRANRLFVRDFKWTFVTYGLFLSSIIDVEPDDMSNEFTKSISKYFLLAHPNILRWPITTSEVDHNDLPRWTITTTRCTITTGP